ncbi:MAG: Ig-like domain-containing protein, partial [Pedobacter sp.]|nr:Ig-like domain-containing protein [Pedobacter sp.]
MSPRLWVRAFAGLCLLSLPLSLLAAYTYEGTEGTAATFFDAHCTGCHNVDSANAGIRFDTAALASTNANAAKNAMDWGDGTYDSASQRMPSGATLELSGSEKLPFNNWRNNGKVSSANADMTTTAINPADVSKYAATVYASVVENGINKDFRFRYSTNSTLVSNGTGGALTSTTSPAGSGGGNNSYGISRAISGLSCGATYYFRVEASDLSGTAGATRSFTTSACPAITGVASGSQTRTEDQSFTLGFNTTGGVSSYTIVAPARGASINGSNQFVWTPSADAYQAPKTNTVYGFTVRVSDGTTSNEFSFDLTVTPVNDQLVFSQPPAANATKNNPFSLNIGALYVSDVDDAAGELGWSITAGQKGNMTISDTGILTWTPGDEALSTQNVTINVQDGLENSTVAVQRTFAINVGGTNVAPVITAISPQTRTVNEDALLS